VTAGTAKSKEDDTAATTQAAAATAHQEQEAFIVAVAAARKTLDEARAREHAVALAWEKEKTIACHLEHQLTTAQGIAIPQDNDDDCSNDASSNPDAALVAHLHAQAAGIQNIRSVVTIFLEPSFPTTSSGATSCFSRFVATPWTTTSSMTSPICSSNGFD
jgi:hypothetical protein